MIPTRPHATSLVLRHTQGQRVIYTKQLLTAEAGRTADVVRVRAAREIELIHRTAAIPRSERRLGSVRLVDGDPEHATIVTEEVPGRLLEDFLHLRSGRAEEYQALRACYLAGRWLRAFQQLPMSIEDMPFFNGMMATDRIGYCDIRLRKLQDIDERWFSDQRCRQVLDVLSALEAKSQQADRQPTICHCDYAPGNMLWDGKLLTPIDFAMARMDVPLLDVTYFIHRLELLPVYVPWKVWPVTNWKRAFLRGYGRPHAEHAPMYRALMLRHLICRLTTYINRTAHSVKQRVHNAWIRQRVRYRLKRELTQATDECLQS